MIPSHNFRNFWNFVDDVKETWWQGIILGGFVYLQEYTKLLEEMNKVVKWIFLSMLR